MAVPPCLLHQSSPVLSPGPWVTEDTRPGSPAPQHLPARALRGPGGASASPPRGEAPGPAFGAEQDPSLRTTRPTVSPGTLARSKPKPPPTRGGFPLPQQPFTLRKPHLSELLTGGRSLLSLPRESLRCCTQTTLILNSSESRKGSPHCLPGGVTPSTPSLSGGPLLGEGPEKHWGWAIQLASGGLSPPACTVQGIHAHPHAHAHTCTHVPPRACFSCLSQGRGSPAGAPLWSSTAPPHPSTVSILVLPGPQGPQLDR